MWYMSNSIRAHKEIGIARPGLDSSTGSVSEMVNYGTNSSLWVLPWENSLSPGSGEKIPIVVSVHPIHSHLGKVHLKKIRWKDWNKKVLLGFFSGCFFVFSFIFLIYSTENINSLNCFQKRNPERLLLFLSVLLLHQLHPLQPAPGQDMS